MPIPHLWYLQEYGNPIGDDPNLCIAWNLTNHFVRYSHEKCPRCRRCLKLEIRCSPCARLEGTHRKSSCPAKNPDLWAMRPVPLVPPVVRHSDSENLWELLRADRADVLLDFIMWKELWVELVGLETGDRTRCSRCMLHNMRWVPICGASWNWKDHSGCWRGGLPGFPLPLQSSYATSKHDSLQDFWQFLSVVRSATMLGASEMIEMWSAPGLR